jgi:hypothetical protein
MYKGLKVGQPKEKKKRKEVEGGLRVGQPMGRKKKEVEVEVGLERQKLHLMTSQ